MKKGISGVTSTMSCLLFLLSWGRSFVKLWMVFLCSAMILVSCNVAWANSTSFLPYVSISMNLTAGVGAVAIGDVTGDGRKDVMVLPDYNDFNPTNQIYVFSQNASGGLNPFVSYTVGKRKHLAIGDVNNDGRNDVVATADSGIGVLLQNSSGGLSPIINYASTNSSVVRISDINGDGRLDVVALSGSSVNNSGGTSVDIFLQNTGGTLDLPMTINLPHSYGGYYDMDVGDVNGDGHIDIVLLGGGGQGEHNITVIYQKADGTFDTPVRFVSASSDAAVGIGDVNGDGREDVIVPYGGNSPTSKISILYQNSSGSLSPSVSYDSYDIPGAVVVTDINHDGRKDIIVAHDGWSTLGIYIQSQNGEIGSEDRYTIPYASWYGAHALAVGDIDNDGLNDMVIGYGGGLAILYQRESFAASNVFPLLSGDSWTYIVDGGASFTQTVQAGTYTINGLPTKLLQFSDGSQMYMSNDTDGIYEHREFSPGGPSTPPCTVTFDNLFKYSNAQMALGQSVYSSGTATFDYSGYGVYYLSYTGTSTFEALESVTVPKGTFDTAKLRMSLTVTGYVNGTYVDATTDQTIWVAQNVGVVKQTVNSHTYELTGTNFTPNPFNFAARTVPPQTVITSNPITVSGISAPATISVEGGEYSIDGGVYTSTIGTVNKGQTVTIRLTSSSTQGATATASLNIGGFVAFFAVTTDVSLSSPLYADLGTLGLWKHDGTSWTQLAPENPENIAASGSILYADLASLGLWKYKDTTWTKLAPENPENIAASGSILYADFGTLGLWKHDGTSWTKLAPENPENIAASGSILYADFGTLGLWKYEGTTWTQLAPENPENIAASGSILYADLGDLGLWKHDGTSWSKLAPENPENIAVSGSNLYADLGPLGLWKHDGTSWSKLAPENPENIAASGSNLYADLGDLGLWKYDGTSWSKLAPENPENIAVGY